MEQKKKAVHFQGLTAGLLGKNASPTGASPLKESRSCYMQTCHLWDTRVEMSPWGAIRATPGFLKKSPLSTAPHFSVFHSVEIQACNISPTHTARLQRLGIN